MIIRGPGIRENSTSDLVTSHTDLAPTILSLIGASPRKDFDGAAIPVNTDHMSRLKYKWQEHVGVEYWGPAVSLCFIHFRY
jgi:arylsulfatase A-like enzyme